MPGPGGMNGGGGPGGPGPGGGMHGGPGGMHYGAPPPPHRRYGCGGCLMVFVCAIGIGIASVGGLISLIL